MKRKENWPSLLELFIQSKRKEAFSWGTFDCMIFVSGGIQEIVEGFDFWGKYRKRYKTKIGAYKLIRRETEEGTFRALVEKVCREKNLQRVEMNFLKRGDIVLASGVSLDGGEPEDVVGIFLGDSFVYADPIRGTNRADMKYIISGWSI